MRRKKLPVFAGGCCDPFCSPITCVGTSKRGRKSARNR